MTIEKKIESLIGYNIRGNSKHCFDSEYQEIFANEGERKAQYIIADLLSKFPSQSQQLSRFAYLCIGGADGSETANILKNTAIQHAILLEISDTAASLAREKSARLESISKKLYVYQGDAYQRLDDALLKLVELKDNFDIHGVIVSAQAVLHELPRRSPNFDMTIFIGKCFSVFEKNIIYCREPIFPEGWPNNVELSIPGIAGNRLKVFAELINDKLKITDYPINAVGRNFVNMQNVLALEVLHKLLRSRSVEEFKYELNEQLTSIKPDDLQVLIEKDLGQGSTRIEPFVTEGFREAWIANCVSVRTPENGAILPIPNTHARILGVSTEISTGISKAVSSIWTTHPLTDEPLEDISILNEEFITCKKDRIGKTRRKSIRSILDRIDNCQLSDFYSLELKARLWRELALEARSQKNYIQAIEETHNTLEHLLLFCSTEKQKKISSELLIEWIIDYSQRSIYSVELNKIIRKLNSAKSYLGKQIDALVNELSVEQQYFSHLLSLRAKCNRAHANLLSRRGQKDKKTEKQVNNLKERALIDAEKANTVHSSYQSKLELSLCLFATSSTTFKDTAKRGLSLLENSWFNGFYLLAGYELAKQYKLRHRFKESIEVFLQIEKRETDRRRLLANISSFSASVIGLHYHRESNSIVREYAYLAREWIEELISYDLHNARDIIDFCHISAICGFPFEEIIKPLEKLKPVSDQTWNQVLEIAKESAFKGKSLDHALLIGLEDAVIWSKIGSIFLEFNDDYERAIEFYDRALVLSPLSPIFYLNKAEALAYHKKDLPAAENSFDSAIRLKKRKWLWFKSKDVQEKIKRLKLILKENSSKAL